LVRRGLLTGAASGAPSDVRGRRHSIDRNVQRMFEAAAPNSAAYLSNFS
jgi:hypothetical protein